MMRTTTLLAAMALTFFAPCVADAGTIQFYGGDPDLEHGYNDGNNGITTTWSFDDFDWTGGRVSGLFGNYIEFGDTTITGMEFEIRSGISSGIAGTLVASGQATSFTWISTGQDIFGFDIYRGTADVTDFDLSAGTYFLGFRPVSTGTGGTIIMTTKGVGGVGAPLGNGNSFTVVDAGLPISTVFRGTPFDMSQGLLVVPLPPAAWMGLGMLGLMGLVRRRRKRHSV